MSLTVILGPMFSGKSTRLIAEFRKAFHFNYNCLMIKPQFDTREDGIKSHLNIEVPARSVKALSEIDISKGNYSFIGIDEFQFFTLKDVDTVNEWAQHFNVWVAVLKDKREENGSQLLGRLIQCADNIIPLQGVCKICGNPASFTKMVINFNPNKPEDYVGGEDKYYCACRLHK